MFKYLKLSIIFFGIFLLNACSDSSGTTVSRDLDNPAFNLTAPNFNGNSSASAPTLSDVETFVVEGTIVSNIVSDADSRHYVMSKNGNSLVINVICDESNTNCSNNEQFSIVLDTDHYINLLIDSNRTLYFSVDDNLYAFPTSVVNEPGGLINLEIEMDSRFVPILDNRGHIILFKSSDYLFSIYNILDVNEGETSLELLHEHTESLTLFPVPPIIVDDKLYVHSDDAVLQYDLLNSYNVSSSSTELQLGDVPVRVFYDEPNSLLVYEYATISVIDSVDTFIKTGLRLFTLETADFHSLFSYTEANRLKSLLGIDKNGNYKFVYEDRPRRSIDIKEYGIVNNQIESLNVRAVSLCRDGLSPFFNPDECSDTLSTSPLYKLSVAFFDGDNSILFGAWVDSHIKLRKSGSNGNAVTTGTLQTDTLQITDSMSDFLNDVLFDSDDSKFTIGYHTFDRPAVVNGAVIITSSNKVFIVR